MNKDRAIINGKIATIQNGKRVVNTYTSGEKLVGKIPYEPYYPYTGYIRGYGGKKNGQSN